MTLLDLLTARAALALADSECADWLTRDDRTRGSEPFGFRSCGEVHSINHREVIRHDRA